MRRIWPIPPKKHIMKSGREWRLHLLALHPIEVRDMTIMIIWRIWNLWNVLSTTRVFLQRMHRRISRATTWFPYEIRNLSIEQIIKGKTHVDDFRSSNVNCSSHQTGKPSQWTALSLWTTVWVGPEWFSGTMQEKSSLLHAIFCSFATNALEAEIHAIFRGHLAGPPLQWSNQVISLFSCSQTCWEHYPL